MHEKESGGILDVVANLLTYGFCILGAVVLFDALRHMKREAEDAPEHIVTSRGRLLFLEAQPGNVYEFQTVPSRRVERPKNVPEADASETRRADTD